MIQDIRNFDIEKRGTWGQGALYEAFGGTISKTLIDRVLDERRKAKGRRRRNTVTLEFVSPGITYATDFIYVRPRGRVLKTQDERARLGLGFQHQDHWPDAEVAAFQEEIFKAHGAPYFFKHDRGSEFTGADFQWMLRQHKVISVPSPAHYPQFNGKMERSNQSDRKWIAPTEANRPLLSRVMDELTQSTLDQNLARRRAPLGGRTAIEVWDHEKRVIVDRDAIYFEWDKLREEILVRKLPNFDRRLSAEMEAMRLAAMVVVSARGLLKYRWPEVPEVST